jgi:hypothetical protein
MPLGDDTLYASTYGMQQGLLCYHVPALAIESFGECSVKPGASGTYGGFRSLPNRHGMVTCPTVLRHSRCRALGR